MHKERQREKLIGEDNFQLVPNEALGIFKLGVGINDYLKLPHKLKHYDYETFSTDEYEFYRSKVVIWITNEDENKIGTICCTYKCYWKGKNIIGMLFDDFLQLADTLPDGESVEYVPTNRDRGQNQTVYEFDKLGLSIWVWRNRVRTVLITKYEEGDN